jgi:NSS family neurotransmitter:Na+ symporter
MGRLWGSLFFVFMSFAALSTVLAVFENIIACVMDLTGWKRVKTCVVVGVGMLILSLPCVFGYNIWSGFAPFGEGSAILDLEDFAVSNVLLPLGALIFTLFCVTRYGWGWRAFTAEANTGKGLKVRGWMRPIFTALIPAIIIVIFVMGLVSFFS